ncbi:protein NUCLEAR FUSION DEFECTIVE 6, chloroplastic/mitochondrial-like isoform X2 [Senna tora]|uniref:Protein NUCLEAR FUSION DEFECTIVE 6, chloroplastic/mitochondrial-like isoform X2 n=1 Tax=Senna tora TaxID=362788 RepID=A0A834SJ08_9FABA|nr:protein NUCLEAR FUSION DEFECTIVE 6, chloroplastic/mitochondrial-like isoform X2 [Senna tora]
MSTASAARSLMRSAASRTFRTANSAAGARARPTCSPFRIQNHNSLSNRLLRSPVELSCCVESMLPYHTTTASALLNSMLSVSCHSYCWNPEGISSFSLWRDLCIVRFSVPSRDIHKS